MAIRQIKRGSWWTTTLIIFVMSLTFLNLVVVTGILVGLIESASEVNRTFFAGDLIISTLEKKTSIENSPRILEIINNQPGIAAATPRYVGGGTLEANYQTLRKTDETSNSVSSVIVGIDPEKENAVTRLGTKTIEGEFLSKDDGDVVVLGAYKLSQYLPIESPGFQTLKNVGIGSRIRMTINGSTREYLVKGILKTKADEIDMRVFVNDKLLRNLMGRYDYSVNEIAIKLRPGVDPKMVKQALLAYDVDRYAKVQTWEEAEPKFVKDMKATFALLGNIIGSIGLAVATITIFIVIFVNAITRRKYIGILKGIGIDSTAIQFSYVLQSLFYASIGIILGLAILYGGLKPYFDANPINFPFSDGRLNAPLFGTLIRGLVLLVATLIAGFIPAKLVVRQNTLDAILGR